MEMVDGLCKDSGNTPQQTLLKSNSSLLWSLQGLHYCARMHAAPCLLALFWKISFQVDQTNLDWLCHATVIMNRWCTVHSHLHGWSSCARGGEVLFSYKVMVENMTGYSKKLILIGVVDFSYISRKDGTINTNWSLNLSVICCVPHHI